MGAITLNTRILSSSLAGLGITGTLALLLATSLVIRHYHNSRLNSFNWHIRNWRLKQLSGIACLFFLAMAASYWVIHDAWGWIYLLVAFKTGIWWFRRAIRRQL